MGSQYETSLTPDQKTLLRQAIYTCIGSFLCPGPNQDDKLVHFVNWFPNPMKPNPALDTVFLSVVVNKLQRNSFDAKGKDHSKVQKVLNARISELFTPPEPEVKQIVKPVKRESFVDTAFPNGAPPNVMNVEEAARKAMASQYMKVTRRKFRHSIPKKKIAT